MNNQTLTILSGLPGSGKSTWAKNNRKENEFIVNLDSMRLMFLGDEYIVGSLIEKRLKPMMIDNIKTILRSGFSVIVDNVCSTANSRKIYTSLKKQFPEITIICRVWIRGDITDCVNNRMNDNRGLSKEKWTQIISNMRDIYEFPTDDEGIDKIIMHEVYKKGDKNV